jgi:hypothetical protein
MSLAYPLASPVGSDIKIDIIGSALLTRIDQLIRRNPFASIVMTQEWLRHASSSTAKDCPLLT